MYKMENNTEKKFNTDIENIEIRNSHSENQEADAWKLNYRVYHDLWVKKNKAKGIYLNAPSGT